MTNFDVVELKRTIDESDVNRIRDFLVMLLNDKENEDEIRKTSVKIIETDGTKLIEVSFNPNLFETGWKEKLDIFIEALLLTKEVYEDEKNRYVFRLGGIDENNIIDSPYVKQFFTRDLPTLHKSSYWENYTKLTVVFQQYQPNIKAQQVKDLCKQSDRLIFTPYFIFKVNHYVYFECSLEGEMNKWPLRDIEDFMKTIEEILKNVERLFRKGKGLSDSGMVTVRGYIKSNGKKVEKHERRRPNRKIR